MTRIIAGTGGWRQTSRAGMILPVNGPEILPIDVRVELSRRDVGVAQHLLDGAQIGAPLQQVRGERMPQRMRRYVLRDAGPLDVLAKDLPRTHAGERLAARVQKQAPLPLPFLEPRA